MQNTKILEMLENDQIDELKDLLKDEIYSDALKSEPSKKMRYAAMKRYIRFTKSIRETLEKPCTVEFEGKEYISFCNGYSIAFTTEYSGPISLFNEPERYPNVTRLVKREGTKMRVNLRKILAEAKCGGYKLAKKELTDNNYLMHCDGDYYRIALVDVTYNIIDNGGEVDIYHEKSMYKPITIENDIGVCVIMPVKPDPDALPSATIIELVK